VLVLAIAILPWVALSWIGEWRPPPDPNAPKASDAIESFRSRAVVTSERLSFTFLGRRADGTRQVWTTPPVGLGMSIARPIGWEATPSSSRALLEPVALCLACRGPPSPAP
jgi:hypothetical protein